MTASYHVCVQTDTILTPMPNDLLNQTSPVLIVDDNPQYTMVLRKILEGGFGFTEVISVESTDQAFSLLTESPEKFKFLFVDFRFQGTETGGDLLQRLGSAGLLENKAVFLITSEPTADNMKQALSAGALGVVAKPFDREDLKRKLEAAARVLSMNQKDSF